MAKKNSLNNIEKALEAVGQEQMLAPEVDVEIEQEEPEGEDEGVSIEIGADGSATITMGEEEEVKETKHYENLAQYMDASDLAKIGEEILEYFDSDVASRDEWERTYAEGFKSLGFQYEMRTKPFRGAAGVSVPLLTMLALN